MNAKTEAGWQMRAEAAEALLAEKEQELAELEEELDLLREQNVKLNGGKPERTRTGRAARRDDQWSEEYIRDMVSPAYMSIDFAKSEERMLATLSNKEKMMRMMVDEMAYRKTSFSSRMSSDLVEISIRRDWANGDCIFSLKLKNEKGLDATVVVERELVEDAMFGRSEGTLMKETAERLLNHITRSNNVPEAPKEVVMQVTYLLLKEFKKVRL